MVQFQDDGTCDYSIASQFDGEWNILQLEYEASIDISPLVSSLDPTIQLLLLGLGKRRFETIDLELVLTNKYHYPKFSVSRLEKRSNRCKMLFDKWLDI